MQYRRAGLNILIMKSWSYLVTLAGVNEKGEVKQEEALYIVATPMDENLFKDVKYSCFSEHYIPEENAIKHGQAYALGVDFEIENPEEYGIEFFNEDDELYIFKEGIPMKEGLKNVFKILMKKLEKEGFNKDFETIRDIGTPSEDLMRECLLEAIKEK
ncbi:putative protein [Aquifex aeolicus VF5]|uniref:Uncharacterized protein aq_935 n=2 Tax=Aquifex aeolicus TaxID=63363 RepID=Y935_AQUAE|nr:RecName: Full=Uncharacterized protein aq_935 [Aquifex aeolicus VF5]AAC07038.1 putative protein [Aquifex aeolicus VF5]